MANYFKRINTPVGELKLVANDTALVAILWENDNPKRVRLGEMAEESQHPILLMAASQLEYYFQGKLSKFSLTLQFSGTEFQKKVWHALLSIPFGETRSYQQIAKQIGHPTASRAVGAANGRNPISIVAPCHRVIGANGSLIGFAGGLETKEFLLALEKNRDFKLQSDE